MTPGRCQWWSERNFRMSCIEGVICFNRIIKQECKNIFLREQELSTIHFKFRMEIRNIKTKPDPEVFFKSSRVLIAGRGRLLWKMHMRELMRVVSTYDISNCDHDAAGYDKAGLASSTFKDLPTLQKGRITLYKQEKYGFWNCLLQLNIMIKRDKIYYKITEKCNKWGVGYYYGIIRKLYLNENDDTWCPHVEEYRRTTVSHAPNGYKDEWKVHWQKVMEVARRLDYIPDECFNVHQEAYRRRQLHAVAGELPKKILVGIMFGNLRVEFIRLPKKMEYEPHIYNADKQADKNQFWGRSARKNWLES